jgi:hypothetical protein
MWPVVAVGGESDALVEVQVAELHDQGCFSFCWCLTQADAAGDDPFIEQRTEFAGVGAGGILDADGRTERLAKSGWCRASPGGSWRAAC